MRVARCIALLLVLFLAVGCSIHDQGWTRSERRKLLKDRQVPTASIVTDEVRYEDSAVAIVTVPNEAQVAPITEPLERVAQMQVSEPSPEEAEEEVAPARTVAGERNPVAQPVHTIAKRNVYAPLTYDGATKGYNPRPGDSVARLAQEHFPGTSLSWMAGVFCTLNSGLTPECSESDFRTLPADEPWLLPAWEEEEESVVADLTFGPSAASESQEKLSPRPEIKGETEAENVVGEKAELPTVSNQPIHSDPWFPTWRQTLWGLLIVGILALVLVVRRRRKREVRERRGIR